MSMPSLDLVGRPPRERRDAAAHRQQVLEAARRLFEERGVEAVTMDEIAEAAGVGKGTLYRRYGDKGKLVLALMNACVAGLDQILTERPASASALDDLEVLLGHVVGWVEEHSSQLGVIADQAAGDRRASRYCNPLYGWLHGRVVACLERAVAQGEASISDCVYVADALLAPLSVELYLFHRQQRGYSPEQILAGLRELVEGLRQRTRR
jgi:AcrR family transcriptional regulator